MINDIYHVKYSVRSSLDKLKHSPDKYQRLFMINDIYHVKYSARNSLDKRKHFQSSIECSSALRRTVSIELRDVIAAETSILPGHKEHCFR